MIMDMASGNPSTQHKSLKNFFDFEHIMRENEIILVYAGDFSQDLMKTLLAFTEQKFAMDELKELVRKRIFNIMVEMLQNISKNAVPCEGVSSAYAPMFMLSESDQSYYLISSNLINKEDVQMIKGKIDQVNSLDGDGLKKLYKQIRLNGSFSNVGGAGIGLIDMARKSANTIHYSFVPVNEDLSTFSLLVCISKTV